MSYLGRCHLAIFCVALKGELGASVRVIFFSARWKSTRRVLHTIYRVTGAINRKYENISQNGFVALAGINTAYGKSGYRKERKVEYRKLSCTQNLILFINAAFYIYQDPLFAPHREHAVKRCNTRPSAPRPLGSGSGSYPSAHHV